MKVEQDLSEWLAPMMASLGAAERTKLMRRIARMARDRNQRRLRAQIQPDGSAFAPRKTPLNKSGFIKRGAMFSKLRLNKFLLNTANAQEAAVFWQGRTGHIAEMHHFGRSETIAGKKYNYPSRQLLGFSLRDNEDFMDTVLEHLKSE